MRNPNLVLEVLCTRAKDEAYRFDKLIRNFYNVEFYKFAYEKIAVKMKNTTERTEKRTTDKPSLSEIETVIQTIKNETYNPYFIRKVDSSKKQDIKKGPKEVPKNCEILVERVMMFILEAIYEPIFKEASHGCRPDKNFRTALYQIKKKFTGTDWWIQGDIKDLLDNINNEKLIDILRKRIKDEKFIRLLRKFLSSGYIFKRQPCTTYTTLPDESIGLLFANIYLHELDRGLEGLAFPGGLKYVRYMDRFLIGSSGTKGDAIVIKEYIENLLDENLLLERSGSVIRITHHSKKIRFLEYDVLLGNVAEKKASLLNKNDRTMIRFSIPHDKVRAFLLERQYIKITNDGKWKATCRPYLWKNEPLEIVRQYNYEVGRLYQYYKFAFDVKEKMGSVHQLVVLSFCRTLAGKFKTKVSKLRDRELQVDGKKYKSYVVDGKWGVRYQNSRDEVKFVELFPFKDLQVVKEFEVDGFES